MAPLKEHKMEFWKNSGRERAVKPIDRFGSMTSPSSKKLIQAIEEALQG
jgi:hypothetical protein